MDKNERTKLSQKLEALRKQETAFSDQRNSNAENEQQNQSHSAWRLAGRYIHLGLEFAIIFALFMSAGYWLDNYLQTSPWMLFLGVLVGFAAALYRLIAGTRVLSD